MMVKILILISFIGIVLWLAAEKTRAVSHRHALKHVIHVNGTRGKSAVTRLIAAGLSAGGYKVFCKTTGTLPMTINPDGTETEIIRKGRANISEQIRILGKAAASGADILVIECMAVDPELQYVCEHRILKSDIGVITNARVDHIAEMGRTVEDVCTALCNTIPKNGVVFTADKNAYPIIEHYAQANNSKAVLSEIPPKAMCEEEMFPENMAQALSVCSYLGIDNITALEGMRHVKKDPYAVSCHRMKNGNIFVNAMSANDVESTELVLKRVRSKIEDQGDNLVILLNSRSDRGYRTAEMLSFIVKEQPKEVWLIGKGRQAAEKKLKKTYCGVIRSYSREYELPIEEEGNRLIYAIGNIADQGMELMKVIREKGTEDVW